MSGAPPPAARKLAHDWFTGSIPDNVIFDSSNYIDSSYSFRRFHSEMESALVLGHGASIYTNATLDFGPKARARIGAYALLNGTKIICDDEIVIGDYCLISWNVVLMDSFRAPRESIRRRSYLDAFLRNPNFATSLQDAARPVTIGSNVWIGHDAVVLPGVSVGTGSVIGARAVVDVSLPDYSVAIGNPVRVIRFLEPNA